MAVVVDYRYSTFKAVGVERFFTEVLESLFGEVALFFTFVMLLLVGGFCIVSHIIVVCALRCFSTSDLLLILGEVWALI